MAKLTNQTFLLQYVIDNCDRLIITENLETDLVIAQASTVKIEQILTPTNFSLADSEVYGKKIIMATIDNVVGVGTGAIQHMNFFSGDTHIHTTDMTEPFNISDSIAYSIQSVSILDIGYTV